MPTRLIADEHGETMKLMDIAGYLVSPIPFVNLEEELKLNWSWKAKEDDVIVCAYPKSGSHWIWEIVSMLKNGRAEYIPEIKAGYELEFLSHKKLDDFPSPRVLNSHPYFNKLPTDFIKKKCKIVFVDRNPKDVAVSFYHHHKHILLYEYEGIWNNYFSRFINGLDSRLFQVNDIYAATNISTPLSNGMGCGPTQVFFYELMFWMKLISNAFDFGSWFDYTLDWENTIEQQKDHPIHVIHYEDMKENCSEEIKRLAKFIGVDENLELFKSIEDLYEFDKMKKGKETIELKSHWVNSESGMYRKGIIGDWKNLFTVSQNEEFDRIYEEKMKKSRLIFKILH